MLIFAIVLLYCAALSNSRTVTFFTCRFTSFFIFAVSGCDGLIFMSIAFYSLFVLASVISDNNNRVVETIGWNIMPTCGDTFALRGGGGSITLAAKTGALYQVTS